MIRSPEQVAEADAVKRGIHAEFTHKKLSECFDRGELEVFIENFTYGNGTAPFTLTDAQNAAFAVEALVRSLGWDNVCVAKKHVHTNHYGNRFRGYKYRFLKPKKWWQFWRKA